MTPLSSQDLEALKALAGEDNPYAEEMRKLFSHITALEAEKAEAREVAKRLIGSSQMDAIAEARRLALEEAAGVAKQYARALSKGTHPKAGSIEEIGERIETAILALKEQQ